VLGNHYKKIKRIY